MDLFLQFGHGMMGHCEHLIEKWGEGTVILSPRDLKKDQLETFSKKISKSEGKTLLDPQYYNPRATHEKLIEHEHWINDQEHYDTSVLSDYRFLTNKFEAIKKMNSDTKTYAYIIPSILCDAVDDLWFDVQNIFLDVAYKIFDDKERYATIALTKEVLEDENAVERLIDASDNWDVDGYYIVPEGEYLIESTYWLSNLAILVAGLKLQSRKVIVAYASHQMLYLSCSKADAIASGTFLNVRSFNSKKFLIKKDDSVSRRAIWYYCPQALSEYRLRALDQAERVGGLDLLKPYGKSNLYTDKLFSARPPSSSGFNESLAFRHYLDELKKQCSLATKSSFEETINFNNDLIESALGFMQKLKSEGIRENNRSFGEVADYNLDAIDILQKEYGALLKRKW